MGVLKELIDEDEFRHWQAYDNTHGLDSSGWWQNAHLMSLVAALVGVKSAPREWIPWLKKQQSPDEMWERLKMQAKAHNARLEQQGKV